MAAHHRLKLRRFARDQLAQTVAGQCMPVIVKGFGETAAVIKGEVFAVVSLFGERDAFFGERPLQGGHVQRFAIGNHSVAVKDDGFKHQWPVVSGQWPVARVCVHRLLTTGYKLLATGH